MRRRTRRTDGTGTSVLRCLRRAYGSGRIEVEEQEVRAAACGPVRHACGVAARARHDTRHAAPDRDPPQLIDRYVTIYDSGFSHIASRCREREISNHVVGLGACLGVWRHESVTVQPFRSVPRAHAHPHLLVHPTDRADPASTALDVPTSPRLCFHAGVAWYTASTARAQATPRGA
jgi:hypothetical protein